MITRIVTLVTLAFALPSTIGAQQDPLTGERVRVTRLDGTVVTGTLEPASLELPEVIVLHGDSRLAIPRIEIDFVQRSRGPGRGFFGSVGATLIYTSLGGGVAGALFWGPCRGDGWDCFLVPRSRGEAFKWGATLGLIGGVPIGVIVGLLNRRERWEPLILNDPSGVELSVQSMGRRSLGVTGRIRFGPR